MIKSVRRNDYTFDAFNHAYWIQYEKQRILGKTMLILLMTDSKLLLYVITGNWYTTEARLMIEIGAVRKKYNERIILNNALIDSV